MTSPLVAADRRRTPARIQTRSAAGSVSRFVYVVSLTASPHGRASLGCRGSRTVHTPVHPLRLVSSTTLLRGPSACPSPEQVPRSGMSPRRRRRLRHSSARSKPTPWHRSVRSTSRDLIANRLKDIPSAKFFRSAGSARRRPWGEHGGAVASWRAATVLRGDEPPSEGFLMDWFQTQPDSLCPAGVPKVPQSPRACGSVRLLQGIVYRAEGRAGRSRFVRMPLIPFRIMTRCERIRSGCSSRCRTASCAEERARPMGSHAGPTRSLQGLSSANATE